MKCGQYVWAIAGLAIVNSGNLEIGAAALFLPIPVSGGFEASLSTVLYGTFVWQIAARRFGVLCNVSGFDLVLLKIAPIFDAIVNC